jgi:hypothetical protein
MADVHHDEADPNDEDIVDAHEAAALNEHGDPYPLTIIRPGCCRKIVETAKRAFSTTLFSHPTMSSEAEALKPYGYGGLAVRYMSWRYSVMIVGVVFLMYSLGDDSYHMVMDAWKKNQHHSKHNLYQKIFHNQIMIATASDLVYAFSLFIALGFWVRALYLWKNYRASARALRIGFAISFCTPFLLMLTFPYRKGVNLEMVAQDSCQDVINGRIPNIIAEIHASGKHSSGHGARKEARKQDKPQIKSKFAHLVANHIPHVNLTNMFHTMHVQIPDTICEFKNPHWAANIKQRLINAGFVRDQVSGTCPAAIKAQKIMHILPKNFKPSTPKFRHLLEVAQENTENTEVFSFDSEKKFTREQCKPCETCVDPQCRAKSMHVLGKQFSLSPVFHHALHAVRHAKKEISKLEKNHEAAIKAAEHKMEGMTKKIGAKFEKKLESANPRFKKIIEEGKKALKVLDLKGLFVLHKFEKRMKYEYAKQKKEQHEMLEKLVKAGHLKIHRARRHGKHAWKKAKKKFAKRFAKAKKHSEHRLKKAKKTMMWKIRKAKAKFLMKKASFAAKIRAARHARLAHQHGGQKVLAKYQARLFAKLAGFRKRFTDKFAVRKAKIKAAFKKAKAKYAARLKKEKSSKSYMAKLKDYVKRIDAKKKVALARIEKAAQHMEARIKHAKAQSIIYASRKDMRKLEEHLHKHSRHDLDHIKSTVTDFFHRFSHTGAHHLHMLMHNAKTAFRKEREHHLAEYKKLKHEAWLTFHKIKVEQKAKLAKLRKEVAAGLAHEKKLKEKANPKWFKLHGATWLKKEEAKFHAKEMKLELEAHKITKKARQHMQNSITNHHHHFMKFFTAAKNKYLAEKKKLDGKNSILKMLAKNTEIAKKKYEARKEKYKQKYRALKEEARHELQHIRSHARAELNSAEKTFSEKIVAEQEKIAKKIKADLKNKAKYEAELKNVEDKAKHNLDVLKAKLHVHARIAKAEKEMAEKIVGFKTEMKTKVARGKATYKAHKAELLHQIHKLRKLTVKAVKKAEQHHKGRKLLATDDAFTADEEMESDEEERRHMGHQKTPKKCDSCHAACFKNCAAQYFGKAILRNTVSSYMCLGAKELNSIDTIKNAMDAVGNLDWILGGQQGMHAFFLLLPASLSFLSAVLKSSKLVKKVLPQSRLAGYLIVLAATSNIPILAAFIALAYQSIGDVWFCLGCLSFLCTFLVFIVNHESLVRSQSHADCSKHIDRRGYLTFVFFGLAGCFLGVYLYENLFFIKAALKLPLRMLIIKKIADFLGRTMFTFVCMTDLVLLMFNMLYGEHGDKVEGQEFAIPLSQIKRLFIDRDQLIERIEAEEE